MPRKDMKKACERGKVDKVKQLLRKSPSLVNEPLDEDCGTALHHASLNGHESVVLVLLAANADIEAKNNFRRTPLHCASHYGKENAVKVLLAANADINAEDMTYKKPGDVFNSSVNESKKQQIQTMLKEERNRRKKKQKQASTPSSSPKSSISKSPPSSDSSSKDMKDACVRGDVEKVKLLLQKSPSLLNERLDSFKNTSLHLASRGGNENVVEVLLAANADIHAIDKSGSTPLHRASFHGFESVVLVLLKANADIEAKDKGGRTPLHRASFHGFESVVLVLLKANADINAKDNKGNKPGDEFESSINESKKQQIRTMLEEERDRRNKNQQQASTPLSSPKSSSSKSPPFSASSSSPQASNPPSSVSQPLPRSSDSSSSSQEKKADRNSHIYLALYDFRAQYPGNLSFKKGDIITVTAQNGGWLVGSLNGRTGTLPSKYVSLLPSGSSSSSQTSSTASSASSGRTNTPSPDSSSQGQVVTSSTSQPPPSSTSSNSQTQEAERIGKIKCKYNEDAIRFTLKKTTTFKELIATVEGEWGEGKGVKFQDEDGDWVKIRTNDDVVEAWKQTKMGVVSFEVFSTQQNGLESTLTTSSSASSTTSSGSTNTPSPDNSSRGQVSGIGWETSNTTPPARCFKQSPQLSFKDSIHALLLNLSEAPPGRPDLRVADEDDVDTLIYCCEHALSQMEASGSADVRQVIGLLAKDEALAILAYTCEDPYPVYRWVNAWLVQDRRDPHVKSSVGPYFRLLYQGLEKLPQKSLKAGRGVLVRNIPVLRNCFNSPPSPGATISFWGISSFSLEDGVASQFGGGAGEEAIYYSCGMLRCVLLGGLSMCPNEAEVLPLPPAVFKVHSTFKVNDKKLVISLDHDETAHARFSYVPPSRK